MYTLIYNIAIQVYALIIKIAAVFSPKAKAFISGRRNLLDRLENELKNNTSPVAWFHCASLGEFEQGRPLIERFSEHYPDYKILLTFFSPSGYEIRKDYKLADWVFYLPMDTPSNAKRFLDISKPGIGFIIKYEFWYHLLKQSNDRKIPLLSISSIFRKEQLFFKPYGGIFKRMFSFFNHFFVQDEESVNLLKQAGIKNYSLAGDTRFDRVSNIIEKINDIPIADAFAKNHKVFVIGSCWPQDMEVLLPLINEKKSVKFIIAPHTLDHSFLKKIEVDIQRKVIRYSKAQDVEISNFDVLLIDNIGMLSSLYQYGDYAYIGGAFGQGLHNILEAATFGLPIFFGNKNYLKFREARELLKLGGSFAVGTYLEISKIYEKLQEEEYYSMVSDINAGYVKNNTGATKKILEYCQSDLEL